MGLALSRGCAIVSLGFAHRGFAAMGLGFCLPWVLFFFFFLLLCGFCSVLMAKIGNKAHFPNNIISRHGFKSIYFTNISSLKDSILGL